MSVPKPLRTVWIVSESNDSRPISSGISEVFATREAAEKYAGSVSDCWIEEWDVKEATL